jgi:hypothetical protein
VDERFFCAPTLRNDKVLEGVDNNVAALSLTASKGSDKFSPVAVVAGVAVVAEKHLVPS